MKEVGALTASLNEVKHERCEYSGRSDDELISLIAKYRDQEALNTLYKRYWHSIACFLKRNQYESSVVDKLYNDIMLSVWNNAETFNDKSDASTWLFNIAYQCRHEYANKDEEKLAEVFNNEPERQENNVNSKQRNAFNALSEKNKTIIELSYYHGFTMDEIASIVDSSVDAVKARLFYARQKLKEML